MDLCRAQNEVYPQVAEHRPWLKASLLQKEATAGKGAVHSGGPTGDHSPGGQGSVDVLDKAAFHCHHSQHREVA